MKPDQPALFDVPEAELPGAPTPDELIRCGAELRASWPRLRFGSMSWAYPGWRGLVYGERAALAKLSSLGLSAYSHHPLLRAVEIDSSYYRPIDAPALRRYAAQTPDDFRFVQKAHAASTVRVFSQHPRFGEEAGQRNPAYLNSSQAAREVVEPFAEGLGAKGYALLFQFSPEPFDPAPAQFVENLHAFLRALPTGVRYAVELRNPERLTPDYGAALADVGAIHAHSVWPAMPGVLAQVRRLPKPTRRPLLVRWMMPPGDEFAEAERRAAPYDRLVREDPARRAELVRLLRAAQRAAAQASSAWPPAGAASDQGAAPELAREAHADALVLVDNKAEGSAPRSIARLVQALLGAE